jgi:hypothetical protein
MRGSGLSDKLYWRFAHGDNHCFRRAQKGKLAVYESLCGRWAIAHVEGQHCGRPASHLRCAICDEREMVRRGWSESGPETVIP